MLSGKVRSTGNVVSGRMVVDIAAKIDVLEPDSAPLTQLTKKMQKTEVYNPEFKWMDEEALTKSDTVNYSTGYTAGDTSIVVDNYTRFRAGDVVKVIASGEQLLVTDATTTANTLVVRRGWGTTAATTIANDAVLLIVGNANAEGASKRNIKVQDQSIRTSYTQIYRTPFGITRTADKSKMYGGKDLKHQRMTQLIEHQKEMERSFWWGEPKEDTSNDTHARRATGGADYWFTTNGKDASGAVTQLEFNEFLRVGFRYGGKKKWLFSAPLITDAISYWASGKLLVAPTDKTFGIDVQQWLTPFGMVNIVNSNLFTEVTTYAGYAYLVDPTQPEYAYLTDSDTRLKTNIQDNDADGEEDEYITEGGLRFWNEKKGSVLYGVTSYS